MSKKKKTTNLSFSVDVSINVDFNVTNFNSWEDESSPSLAIIQKIINMSQYYTILKNLKMKWIT
jgi:hypothetical protein